MALEPGAAAAGKIPARPKAVGVDLGEAVARPVAKGLDEDTARSAKKKRGGEVVTGEVEEGNAGKESKLEAAETQKAASATQPTPTKRPKKKRKKGDLFDDLFGNLV